VLTSEDEAFSERGSPPSIDAQNGCISFTQPAALVMRRQ